MMKLSEQVKSREWKALCDEVTKHAKCSICGRETMLRVRYLELKNPVWEVAKDRLEVLCEKHYQERAEAQRQLRLMPSVDLLGLMDTLKEKSGQSDYEMVAKEARKLEGRVADLENMVEMILEA